MNSINSVMPASTSGNDDAGCAVNSWNDGQRHRRKNDELLRDTAEQNSGDAPGAAFADDDGVHLLFLCDLDDRLSGFAGARFEQIVPTPAFRARSRANVSV